MLSYWRLVTASDIDIMHRNLKDVKLNYAKRYQDGLNTQRNWKCQN